MFGIKGLSWVRFAFTLLNQTTILAIILTTNIGNEGEIGLILNFTAAYVVSDLDDIMYYAINK